MRWGCGTALRWPPPAPHCSGVAEGAAGGVTGAAAAPRSALLRVSGTPRPRAVPRIPSPVPPCPHHTPLLSCPYCSLCPSHTHRRPRFPLSLFLLHPIPGSIDSPSRHCPSLSPSPHCCRYPILSSSHPCLILLLSPFHPIPISPPFLSPSHPVPISLPFLLLSYTIPISFPSHLRSILSLSHPSPVPVSPCPHSISSPPCLHLIPLPSLSHSILVSSPPIPALSRPHSSSRSRSCPRLTPTPVPVPISPLFCPHPRSPLPSRSRPQPAPRRTAPPYGRRHDAVRPKGPAGAAMLPRACASASGASPLRRMRGKGRSQGARSRRGGGATLRGSGHGHSGCRGE